MRRFFAALILSMVTAFGAHTQARKTEPKATEYNFSICSPGNLMAEHGVLSADGKSLDFNYYRNGDVAVKDEMPTHLILQGQTSDPRKDGSRKFDAVGYIPDGQGGKATVIARGQIYKDRFVILVFIHDELHYVLYGREGGVDGLVKLDKEEAVGFCLLLLNTGTEEVPDAVVKWLHQDDAPSQSESKS